ncbi:hypothetical protein GCM10018785_51730 [Streptomyces longispororuber]|uniref:HTH tetR-type domain-containing protein n=1 Tax=Streptomyces longispororuber TaxID=68230 RepID=A0A918ZZQ8_9ACTN|nr:TetR/AcrR family transcriptional regulator [Streptomyces longispororuber]GHE77124.1 hypothetical protein GCM10018785_51730 [Streptomyces longispororuber]
MRTEKPTSMSVWTRPSRQRRDQPALSREQIVAEALALLDAEGLEALSMRKLGTRLNAGATSLYTHVSNKDEIIELVVDRVYGEIDVPVPASASHEDWRAAALGFGENVREVLLRHIWIASVLGELGMANLGPNMMRLTEDMLALFETRGFDLESCDIAVKTIWGYVIGIATTEAAYLTTLARSGRDEQAWMETVRPAVETAVRPYPRVRAMYELEPRRDVQDARQGYFQVGLNCILDGLEARLPG